MTSESAESSHDNNLGNTTGTCKTSISLPRNSMSDNTGMSAHDSGKNDNAKREDSDSVREITDLNTMVKLVGSDKPVSEIGRENVVDGTVAQRREVSYNRSQSTPFTKLVKLSKSKHNYRRSSKNCRSNA